MTVKIGPHVVGAGEQPFVVAEMSGNHNGALDRALAIVDAAADAGRARDEAPDVHGRHHHHRRRTPRRSASPSGHELWGGREPLPALRAGAHAVGVARADLRAGPGAGADRLLQPVRPHRGRPAGGARRAALQDRLVGARRPAADPAGRGHRQAADHLHRHGDGRRDRRRGRAPPATAGCDEHRAAGLHGVVPGPAGETQPAPHPGAGRRLRRAGRPVRPHARASACRSPRWRSAPASSRSTSRSTAPTAASTRLLAGTRPSWPPWSSSPSGRWQALGGTAHRARPRPSGRGCASAARSSWSPTCGPATRSPPRTSARSGPPAACRPTQIDRVLGRTFTTDVPRGTPLTWDPHLSTPLYTPTPAPRTPAPPHPTPHPAPRTHR